MVSSVCVCQGQGPAPQNNHGPGQQRERALDELPTVQIDDSFARTTTTAQDPDMTLLTIKDNCKGGIYTTASEGTTPILSALDPECAEGLGRE